MASLHGGERWQDDDLIPLDFLSAERPGGYRVRARLDEHRRYHRWWLQRSGLSRDEIREIAAGLLLYWDVQPRRMTDT
jgi:hypothetical protein